MLSLTSVNMQPFCVSFSYSCVASSDSHKLSEGWKTKKKTLHINCKELLAFHDFLKNFESKITYQIKLQKFSPRKGSIRQVKF